MAEKTLIITGCGEAYAYAAAMALVAYPDADIEVASRSYLPKLVMTLARGRNRPRYARIMIMGVGLTGDPEQLADAFRRLARRKEPVLWFSTWNNDLTRLQKQFETLLPVVDPTVSLARCVGQELGILGRADDQAWARQQIGSSAAAANRIATVAEPATDETDTATTHWRNMVNRAFERFLERRDADGYIQAIRRLVIGNLPAADTADGKQEVEMLTRWQESARQVFRARSHAARSLRSHAADLAESGISPMLITGEAGTGKALLARYIHDIASPVAVLAKFIKIECRGADENDVLAQLEALATEAAESRKIAGADERQPTILLHHVEALPPTAQNCLIAWLDARTDTPSGVRLIASCDADAVMALDEGRLNEGLWWRLRPAILHCPPLRERPEDVIDLATDRLYRLGWRDPSPEQAAVLQAYEWPGNVRQLRQVIERAVALGTADFASVIGTEAASLRPPPKTPLAARVDGGGYLLVPLPLPDIDTVVRLHAQEVYRRCDENKTQAAKVLGVSFNTISKYLAEAETITAAEKDQPEPKGQP